MISLFLDDDHFRYSNYSGSYTTKEHFIKPADTVLYRLFSKNPLRFWLIKDYFIDPRYNLPYKNWAELKKRRGYEIKGYRTNYQKF